MIPQKIINLTFGFGVVVVLFQTVDRSKDQLDELSGRTPQPVCANRMRHCGSGRMKDCVTCAETQPL